MYLVKVGLQEVNLLRVLEKAGPVLKLELLLAQDQLNLTVGVVDLAVLGVDLGVEVQGDGVCDTLARSAGERDIGRSDAQLGLGLRNVGGLQVHVEVVPLRVGVGGALSPCDCNPDTSPVSDRVRKSIIYALSESVEPPAQGKLEVAPRLTANCARPERGSRADQQLTFGVHGSGHVAYSQGRWEVNRESGR